MYVYREMARGLGLRRLRVEDSGSVVLSWKVLIYSPYTRGHCRRINNYPSGLGSRVWGLGFWGFWLRVLEFRFRVLRFRV